MTSDTKVATYLPNRLRRLNWSKRNAKFRAPVSRPQRRTESCVNRRAIVRKRDRFWSFPCFMETRKAPIVAAPPPDDDDFGSVPAFSPGALALLRQQASEVAAVGEAFQ